MSSKRDSGPRISVLIPTRDRLEYLRYAVETVTRQDYDEWQLVIADNSSQEDIAGYAASLADARIRYIRSADPVPVTENWNRALSQASGEYVIMLGDDDCLMPGYFAAIEELIETFSEPDAIYSGAKLFAYPGVFPDSPEAFVQPYGYADFLAGASQPFLLQPEYAKDVVRAAAGFRVRYGFNMQFLTVRRAFVASLSAQGDFFQSPFPDYYAMNATFLKASRIVADPRPLVVIGVTPMSYGYYHAQGREDDGRTFLSGGTETEVPPRLREIVLPGSNINTGWLLAMDALRESYGDELGVEPDYRRYRFLQVLSAYRSHYEDKSGPRADLELLRRRLRLRERIVYASAAHAFVLTRRVLPSGLFHRLTGPLRRRAGQFPEWDAGKERSGQTTILDVFERAEPVGGPEPRA